MIHTPTRHLTDNTCVGKTKNEHDQLPTVLLVIEMIIHQNISARNVQTEERDKLDHVTEKQAKIYILFSSRPNS
jgi:hypothetical protein